ncbi:MAG TPA: serine/threonine-protein kinase [Kofleriaceae bacterium]|nr:serine/threonine-protein kinase [Kofleriaceae bacterium]
MIGREIAGRYRVVSKLGEGGMGAVYKAEQISLKRTCAIKLLRPDVSGAGMQQMMLRRFNAEAEAVAKLSHPNTVNIYDFGQDTDGTFFIAMEFVEGRSLRETIHAEAPFPPRRALAIAAQVAASLTDAHAANIVHRDLKPDNVMLQTRGRQRDVVRVLDFGIAKLRDEGRATQAAMTQAGDMLGTPQYMAPEQIRGERIDGRTDVYALGCMLYEMVTGRMPFEAPTVMALLSKHLLEQPPAPSQRRPDLLIPPAVDELIMTAMHKDANARPPTMELYGERIGAVLASLPVDTSASTAQQSAVVGVPNVPSPTPYGQPGFAPPTPPPPGPPPGSFGHAPTPPPAGRPHTPPQGPSPYQAYSPFAGAAPTPPPAAYPAPPRPASSGSGGKLLAIILIAAGIAAAAGIAIYFGVRKTDKPKPDDPQHLGSDGSNDADDSDTDDNDDKPDTPPTPSNPSDPWSGGSGTPPTAGGTTDTTDTGGSPIAKMKSFRAVMCACKDRTCAERVTNDMQKWSTELSTNPSAMTALGVDGAQQFTEEMKQFTDCATRAFGLGASSVTPPPAPVPAPTTAESGTPNEQIDALADRACKCRNATCARKVVNDLVVLVRANEHAVGVDQVRAEASGRRIGECVVKAGMPAAELMKVLGQLKQ